MIETSRGCTFDCSFCSIIEMRGRNFHTYSFDRVFDGHPRRARPWRASALHRRRQHHAQRAPVRGALPSDHRRGPERARLLRSGDDFVHRQSGEPLARLMRRAGFRYVFLGIENILGGRPAVPAGRDSRIASATRAGKRAMLRSRPSTICIATACSSLAGLIVGNPGDTRAVDRRSISNSPDDMSIGHTSSTQLHTRARP